MTDQNEASSGAFLRVRDSFCRQSFLSLIGAELEDVRPGRVTVSCRLRDDLTQQQGLLHGGVMATVADVTCGYTALTVIQEGYEVMSVEFKLNLLRPVSGSGIRAVGSLIRAGRTLVVTEAEVQDIDSGKLVAKMLATMIPAPLQSPKTPPRSSI